MKYDYNKSQIFESLIKVGIKKNDIVYCHANLGFLETLDPNNIAKLFFEVLKKGWEKWNYIISIIFFPLKKTNKYSQCI